MLPRSRARVIPKRPCKGSVLEMTTTNQRLEMTAIITARPGTGGELRQRLSQLVAETVKEPGCLEFRVFETIEQPDQFVLWEIFASQEALRAHLDTSYTKAYFASGLVERTQVIRHRSL